MSWRAPWLRERISLVVLALWDFLLLLLFIPLIIGGARVPGLVDSSIGALIIVCLVVLIC